MRYFSRCILHDYGETIVCEIVLYKIAGHSVTCSATPDALMRVTILCRTLHVFVIMACCCDTDVINVSVDAMATLYPLV